MRERRTRVVLVAALVVLAAASRGAAQETPRETTSADEAPTCPPGMARSLDTAGRCCWPRQAYSRALDRCVGIPRCPTGTHAEGETCATGEAPPSDRPRVAIEAPYDEDVYDVTVDGVAIGRTPCETRLAPGPHAIVARGPATIAATVVVPAQDAKVLLRRRFPALVAIGAVAGVVGLAALGVGAGLIFEGYSSTRDETAGPVGIGVVALVAGPPLLSSLILLTGYTKQDALVLPYGVEGRASPGVRFAGAAIAPLPSGAAASAAFSF